MNVEAHFTGNAVRLYVSGHRLRLIWAASVVAWALVAVDALTTRRRDRIAHALDHAS